MSNLFNLPQEIKDFQNTHQLNDSVNKIRGFALERLQLNDLPHRRTESWKYTNIKPIVEKELKFNVQTSTFKAQDLRVDGFTNIFFVNGVLSDQSDTSPFEMSALNEKSLEIIKANAHGLQDDFAYNLNESTIYNGLHFNLKKNTHCDRPIIIFHILDSDQDIMRTNQNTFNIEENCFVEVLEVYISIHNTSSLINFASNITVAKNSKFVHLHHQILENQVNLFNNVRAQVSKDASYNSFTITIGGALTRNNIHIDLNQEGANCMAHGVYTLQGTQHSDVNSFINHTAPHTESAQLYKGIMSDKSRGVFTGLIKVDRDAQFINSAQLNKNLLLSKGAHVNSRPQLEIFADDVKCSHGSTTGQLNEDELFYFESRGIRPEKARMMLSHAYTYDVLLKINNKNIRNYIQADIVEKFEKSAFEAKNA